MGVLAKLARFFGILAPRFTVPREALMYFANPGAWKPVTSSNVGSIGYYASVQRGAKSVLGVHFHTSDTTYYYDVPSVSTWLSFCAAPSKGKWVWAELIRKNVPFAGPY